MLEKLGAHPPALGGIAAWQDQLGAPPCQSSRDLEADAAGRAGYDRQRPIEARPTRGDWWTMSGLGRRGSDA